MIALRHTTSARSLHMLLCIGLLLIAAPLIAYAINTDSDANRKDIRVVVTVADAGAAGLMLILNDKAQLQLGGAGFFTVDTMLRSQEHYSATLASFPTDRSLNCNVSPSRGTATRDVHLAVLCTRSN